MSPLAAYSSAHSVFVPNGEHTAVLGPGAHCTTKSSSACNMTFLLNLPWGGTAAASFPLLDLPVLTALEIQQLPCAQREKGTLSMLSSFATLHPSAVDLYLPGSFLISLAAQRAGWPGKAAAGTAVASELRVILQQREIHAFSFVPLDTVVGAAAAALVAAARRGVRFEPATAAQQGQAREPPLCSLWLLLRLRGGKGGFGALLKKQGRKKRANFSIDACRDLTGRRIRQAQVVTRVKAWMEKKRKEDALVSVLAQDTQEKLPEAKPAVSLDSTFIAQQIAHVSNMPDLVARGLKQQLALRKEQEAERRARATAPQNRAVYALLRDAVELTSEDDQWSDAEEDGESTCKERDSSSGSSSSSASCHSGPASGSITVTSNSRPSVTCIGSTSRSNRGNSSSNNTRRNNSCGSSSSSKTPFAKLPAVDAAAKLLMSQLDEMRLKAASAEEAQRREKAEAAAQLAKAAAEAEQAAAEAAERVARQAEQLDVTPFSTAEELAKAVDEAVVKEKLRQLGWKCGGRPEERAARLLQLKKVDLANVPKALLARQPTRKA